MKYTLVGYGVSLWFLRVRVDLGDVISPLMLVEGIFMIFDDFFFVNGCGTVSMIERSGTIGTAFLFTKKSFSLLHWKII